MKTIMAMADICHDYEPDENQHIGSFPSEGRLISFKIDHYERPARSAGRNGQVDHVRVITVMLAEEA
jgi:Protein of unknown function (DUF3768)